MTYSRYQRGTISFGGPLTPAVKGLIIVNVVIFVLRFLVSGVGDLSFDRIFGLVPWLVTRRLFLWQFVTYMFIHAGPFHILFNMLMLWMFGGDVERLWGIRRFLNYYFLTGIGAGFCSYIVSPGATTVTVGASGAIFGLLMAYGILFSDRIIYLYFLFPIRAKYFVMIMGAIEFYLTLAARGSGIANTAHLGGMIFGYGYLKRGRLSLEWRNVWSRWKAMRARRKFRVYMREVEEKEKRARHKERNKHTWIQ